MHIDKSKKIQNASSERRWKIRKTKGHDYATEDILSNFKRMSCIMDAWNIDIHTPHGVALFYACLKIDRLCNLVFSGKSPTNEPLQDTVDDLKNYIDLMEECMIEVKLLEDTYEE